MLFRNTKMTSAKREFHELKFTAGAVYGATCFCIILSGTFIWAADDTGKDFPYPGQNAGGNLPLTLSGDVEGGLQWPVGVGMGSDNLSRRRVTAGIRRMLVAEIQRVVILGLMDEDGSLNLAFIRDGKEDGKEDGKTEKRRESEDMSLKEGEEEEENLHDDDVLKMAETRGRHEHIPVEIREAYSFKKCSSNMRDYIPCFDHLASVSKIPDAAKGEKWERHCPKHQSVENCCIIAKPAGYRQPVRWPKSKDEVWAANVRNPQRTWDKTAGSIQNGKLLFPVADIRYPKGADFYLDQLTQMVPGLAFGSQIRTALDVACGAASFAAALISRGVLPLSISPKELHKSSVQLALERGVPAMVADVAGRRLLYSSQAFDLIHCSDCGVEWTRDGGLPLLEINRLLCAGGYFVWAAPSPVDDEQMHESTRHEMEDLTTRICWTLVAKEGFVNVWQKPHNSSCYWSRAPRTLPSLCDDDDDPDAVWYVDLKRCISQLPTHNSTKLDWPARLSALPERAVTLMGADVPNPDVFVAQQRHWDEIVSGYLRGLGLKKESVRNVMDMRAGFGGFAAAMAGEHSRAWVMNVVPTHGLNSLPVIYDRGLLGVAHDWCESFDTYPRTYDLLHAAGLFTAEEKRCNATYIILEMDRILRPGGMALIRESKAIAMKLQPLAKAVRWRTRILATESGPYGKEKLLVCVKRR